MTRKGVVVEYKLPVFVHIKPTIFSVTSAFANLSSFVYNYCKKNYHVQTKKKVATGGLIKFSRKNNVKIF